MKDLVREDPRRALESSLRWHEWEALPDAVRAEVEEPFSARSDLSVYPDCGGHEEARTPWHTHHIQWRGQDHEAYVFG